MRYIVAVIRSQLGSAQRAGHAVNSILSRNIIVSRFIRFTHISFCRLRSPRRPLVATQQDGGTFSHFFFRSLHDCRKIPPYFARLSQRLGDTRCIVRPGERVVIRCGEGCDHAIPNPNQSIKGFTCKISYLLRISSCCTAQDPMPMRLMQVHKQRSGYKPVLPQLFDFFIYVRLSEKTPYAYRRQAT